MENLLNRIHLNRLIHNKLGTEKNIHKNAKIGDERKR